MRTVDVQQKGKRGNVVASRNRFGQYLKEYVPPDQPGTASQRKVWASMAQLSWLWNEISDERREAWHSRAMEVRSRPSLGESGPLDGILLFKKINTVLRVCDRDILLDPPRFPAWTSNPVVGFAVREVRGEVALRLKIARDIRWDARPPLEDLMVFAWAPCNAGVRKNTHYAFLGILPAPVKGECNITKLYLEKLKQWRRLKHWSYHIPLEGSRIFIRVWQQVNGWENALGMFQANALAPARQWPRWPRKTP